ncbi:hypothetical protein J0910_15680 [Nocardiopsis sp. CNT-189]|uniref:hypothetical protein n=1 Tax=Nocardiopsis oceanisediminis TaxID=2816862 RepID=UPI003B2F2A6B
MESSAAPPTGHLIDLHDLGPDGFAAVLDAAGRWKGGPRPAPARRRPRVATLFTGAAFRTRLAFDTAIAELGGHRLDLPDGLNRREPMADAAAVLAHYADAVVVRTPDHAALAELAAHSAVPVVNAMTSLGHPCEVVSEAFTLAERFGAFRGLRIAFVGGDGNLCRSWLEAAAVAEVEVVQVCPPGWEAPREVLDRAASGPGRAGVVHDLAAGLAGADAVYTDVWPEEARVPGGAREEFARFRIDRAALDRAAGRAVLMHCMPVRRGDEVTAEAFADPRCIALEAKGNLGPTHTAILDRLLAGGG